MGHGSEPVYWSSLVPVNVPENQYDCSCGNVLDCSAKVDPLFRSVVRTFTKSNENVRAVAWRTSPENIPQGEGSLEKQIQ